VTTTSGTAQSIAERRFSTAAWRSRDVQGGRDESLLLLDERSGNGVHHGVR
jgi:hypothetical protein